MSANGEMKANCCANFKSVTAKELTQAQSRHSTLVAAMKAIGEQN
jgi:hypothetical protein